MWYVGCGLCVAGCALWVVGSTLPEVSIGTAGAQQLDHFQANDWRKRKHVVLNLFPNTKMSEPHVQVVTLRGFFLVSRKLAMRHDSNIGLRCCSR